MAKKKPYLEEEQDVISSFEQTGLIPSLPEDEAEEESYESLYPIHEQQDAKEKHGENTGHRS